MPALLCARCYLMAPSPSSGATSTSSRNLAYSHCIDHVVGTDKHGEKVDLTLRVTDVYKKARGGYRVIHEHVSVPVDLATNKPDLASKP